MVEPCFFFVQETPFKEASRDGRAAADQWPIMVDHGRPVVETMVNPWSTRVDTFFETNAHERVTAHNQHGRHVVDHGRPCSTRGGRS